MNCPGRPAVRPLEDCEQKKVTTFSSCWGARPVSQPSWGWPRPRQVPALLALLFASSAPRLRCRRRAGDSFEFNTRLWNQFLRIAQPYFLPFPDDEEASDAQPGFVALILATLVGVVGGTFWLALGAGLAASALLGTLPEGLGGTLTSMQAPGLELAALLGVLGASATFAAARQRLQGHWRQWWLLALLLFLLFCVTGLNVLLSYVFRAIDNVLVEKNATEFYAQLGVFGAALAVAVPVISGYRYVRLTLGRSWRQKLTELFLEKYLENRSFYLLDSNSQSTDVDNPDQRISEDVDYFTKVTLDFLLDILDSVLNLVSFSAILWTTSQTLTGALAVYALVGTSLAVYLGGRLVGLNYEQLRLQADFRYSLVHVRDNAEAIAFYGGEKREEGEVKAKLGATLSNYDQLIIWETGLSAYQQAFFYLARLVPYFVLGGLYFSGQVDFGTLGQAQFAFSMVLSSVTIIVSRIQDISRFSAGISRLGAFLEALTKPPDAKAARISTLEGSGLQLQKMTLFTPDGSRLLLKDLDMALSEGRQRRLLVVGSSGVGKSSVLRAVAGLWNRGEGTIVRPPSAQMLFLPQRPYMPLGDLRTQLLYPSEGTLGDHADAELEDSNLATLVQEVPACMLAMELKVCEEALAGPCADEVASKPEARDEESEPSKSIATFLALMTPVSDESIRSAAAYLPLRNFGEPLRKSDDGWYHLSEPAAQIDTFWSHSWHGNDLCKIFTLLVIYNSRQAMVIASFGALLASFLYAGQLLPGWDVDAHDALFNSVWALVVGTVFYLVLLFAGRPRERVFLDIVCIDQKDRSRKREGTRSISAFIKRSKSMIVLWDTTFSRRMWCIFELSAYLHSRSPDEGPHLTIRPTVFGPTFFCLTVGMVLVHGIIMLFEGAGLIFVEGVVVCVGFYTFVLTCRHYFRSLEQLQHELHDFTVDEATCQCCSAPHPEGSNCDKEMLLNCIRLWFGSVEVFEERVRKDVLCCLMEQLSGDFFSYRQCIVALIPAMWSGLDYASGAWLMCTQLIERTGLDGDGCPNQLRGPPGAFLVNWLLRAAVWWLGVVPSILLLGMKAMYYLRQRSRSRCLDEVVNMAILVWMAALVLGMIELESLCWRLSGTFPVEPINLRRWWCGMVVFASIMLPSAWVLFAFFGMRRSVVLYKEQSSAVPTPAKPEETGQWEPRAESEILKPSRWSL
ncbi:unnamed protein product [Symbiodinium microadriaticum]|nr:unnamed protein product [Symbiodinium microadriaticum]